jgi:hypothetical protein
MDFTLHYLRNILTQYLFSLLQPIQSMENATESTSSNTGVSISRSGNSEAARFFFWISPHFNIDFFIFILPILMIPIALAWIFIIYPPGKFYANVPFNRNGTATIFKEPDGLFRKRRAVLDLPTLIMKKNIRRGK